MPLLDLMDGRLGSQASLHPPQPHVPETSTSPSAAEPGGSLITVAMETISMPVGAGTHWQCVWKVLGEFWGKFQVPALCSFFFLEIPMSIQFLLKIGMVEKPQSEVWPLSRFSIRILPQSPRFRVLCPFGSPLKLCENLNPMRHDL